MEKLLVTLHGRWVELRCPADIAADLRRLFPDTSVDSAASAALIVVEREANGLFAVRDSFAPPVSRLNRVDVATFVMEAIVRGLLFHLDTAVALHAGAVAMKGRALLVAGPSGAGKSSLVAWLVDQGFEYLSDEIAVLPEGRSEISGFRRALVVKPGASAQILRLAAFRDVPFIRAGSHAMLPPTGAAPASESDGRDCRLIAFPKFTAGAALQIQPLTPAETGLRLMACNLNARNLSDGGFRAVSALARRAPAFALVYGDFDALDGVLDALARSVLDGEIDIEGIRDLLARSALASPAGAADASSPPSAPAPAPRSVPAPAARRPAKKLTIGMATYDDYDGVYFTVQSLRLHHPEIIADAEFVVVDNNPDGPCAEALRALANYAPNYHYVAVPGSLGTGVRDFVFRQAAGEFVVCMDCHVLVAPGALSRLLAYFEAHPASDDLLQGPMLLDDLVNVYTHWAPAWRGGMFGTWETDPRGTDIDSPPFEIPLQGLGLFACRRAAWPGFNPSFRGFGGEEGYIHEKFRRKGARALCLPFLRWVHRFNRPMGVPYANKWEDRIRNYIIGHAEFGLPTTDLEAHFEEVLGAGAAKSIFDSVKSELEAVL